MRALRTTILCLLAAVGGGLAVRSSPAASAPLGPVPTVVPAAPATPPDPVGPIVHVVLFDLPPTATPDEARALAIDSRALLRIPGVESVWVGPKALDDRETHVKDYDVALCVRLRSLADLKAYGSHPQHRELVEKWKGRATWRVIDFYDR